LLLWLQRLIAEEQGSHEWIMEVRPQYIVPDTNTFIDYRLELKAILDSGHYTLLVPLLVLTELSSLSLGEHASAGASILPNNVFSGNTQQNYVESHAKETIQLLRDEADKRNPRLLAVTTNGNILPRFSFASETSDYASRVIS